MNPAESATAPAGLPTQDERTWGTVAHLAALAFFVMPFGNIIGPLVVYLAKRDHSAFVAAHAKEALNFNITFLLAALGCILLLWFSIGILLAAILLVFWLVMTVVAALQANEGVAYRYPFTVRMVK